KRVVVIRSPSPQLVPFKLHRFGQQRPLEYQSEFRGGCDTKVWHPAPVTRSIRDIEREKKERAAKLRMKRAVLAASQMTGQGPRPIGQ
ncbi:hypothetical protein ACK340_09485, partial [Aeromonas veronii]